MHVTMGNETLLDGSFEVKRAFDFYDETGTLPKLLVRRRMII